MSEPYSRDQMLQEVGESAKQNPAWGIELANALACNGHWESDLWPRLIRSWSEAELDEEGVGRVLNFLGSEKLRETYARDICMSISSLAQIEANLQNPLLRTQANNLALELWDHVSTNDALPLGGENDWLMQAINHEAGNLARFWILSISAWRKSFDSIPDRLNEEHLTLLTKIIQNEEVPGKLARCALVNQFSFMLAVDPEWTEANLLPPP